MEATHLNKIWDRGDKKAVKVNGTNRKQLEEHFTTI